jgi:2Fe-2S ferredoxin
MSDIKIHVLNSDDSLTTVEAPTDMGLSLMEVLKSYEYEIPATCGGMALCATCHVEVIRGYENLKPIGDDEYAMLDTLPNITGTSRLSCQIRISEEINDITVKIKGDGLS